ncbi:MAG: GntR family transcriptional regulator [Bacillota bacterium]|nr:GntR family transcriptional regulator [Bacillota bacterium]HPQ01889.1 GntR family transcriptional regulator [Bacillota bacterium]HQD80107.1 GntR family transcriptional regulator [Bacillota bacterium]
MRQTFLAPAVRDSGRLGWDDMDIAISPNNPVPMYQQIVDQVRAQILSGELKPGDPLPSIRKLAADLLASVITTKRAYADLEAEGLIVTRPGLGTFVADLSLEDIERLKAREVIGHLANAVEAGRSLGLEDSEIAELLQNVLDGRVNYG